jgi:hypothetical protein
MSAVMMTLIIVELIKEHFKDIRQLFEKRIKYKMNENISLSTNINNLFGSGPTTTIEITDTEDKLCRDSNISFIQVLKEARTLLIECYELMDNPKALYERLDKLSSTHQKEIRNLVISLRSFGSYWGISEEWKKTAPKITGIIKDKKFRVPHSIECDEKRSVYQTIQNVATFLLNIYNLRKAFFKLRLEMENLILNDCAEIRCLTESLRILGVEYSTYTIDEIL